MTSPYPEEYREIALTKGKVAIVSVEDFEKYGRFKWYALQCAGDFYAVRMAPRTGGKRETILMHREILGLKKGDPRRSDHALHNTLDNRLFVDGRENLRIASSQENNRNQRLKSRSKSGFKGVSFAAKYGKWQARIRLNGGVRKWLGSFDSPELAYAAYCKAAEEYFGRFACFG